VENQKIVILSPSELKEIIQEATEKGVIEGINKGTELKLNRDEWLTTKEAAALLKVKPATLRTWSSEGRITAHYKGKSLLFKRSEIMASSPENMPPARY
jgi:excisionase family DNA binding protein